MKACTINLNNRIFTEEEFKQHLKSYVRGVNDNLIIPQADVKGLLSQVKDHIKFNDDPITLPDGTVTRKHEYTYDITGELFTSVTTKINRDLLATKTISATKKGDYSRGVGTIYHNIFEAVMQGLGNGKSISDIRKQGIKTDTQNDKKLEELFTENETYLKVFKYAEELYKDWTADGSIVMSEFLVGNLNAKISGTIDIAIIHKDGSITLVDFKGTRHEYKAGDGKSDLKKNSNNLQLNIYKQILMVGDTKLGLPPLNVRDAYVLPLISQIDGTEDAPILSDVDIQPKISISDKSMYPNGDVNIGIAKTLIRPTIIKPSGLKVAGVPDFDTFFNITGYDDSKIMDPHVRAAAKLKKVFKNKAGEFQYSDTSGKNVVFKWEGRTDEGPDGIQSRKDQLLTYFENIKEREDVKFAEQVIMAHENPGHNVFDNSTELQIQKNVRLKQMLSRYDPLTDYMVLANTIPGLENVGHQVILVYRNMDMDTGTYTQVDFLNVDQSTSDVIPIKDKYRGSIFGDSVPLSSVKAAASSLKLSPVILENDKKSNVLMRLGMVAMALKKANPDLKVGNVVAMSVNSLDQTSHNRWLDFTTMKNVTDHVKIMNELGLTGNNSKLSSELNVLLNDKELLNSDTYMQNEVEAYLNFMSLHLKSGEVAQKSIVKGAEGFFKYNIMSLINGDEKDPQVYRKYAKQLRDDSDGRRRLIVSLVKRMTSIRTEYNNKNVGHRGLYESDREYQMISKTVLSLYAIMPSLDSIVDISKVEALVSSGGLTSIPLVDSFVTKVKVAHDLASREVLETYTRDKLKMMHKLFGKNPVNYTVGNTTRHFDKLIETKEVNTAVGDRKVTRKTMRFWPEKTPQYDTLTDDQKEFITWFNNRVEAAFTVGMTDEEIKVFKNSWVRGQIPLMRSSTSNLLYKTVTKDKDYGYGGITKMFSTMWKLDTDRHADRSEYFEQDAKLDEIAHYFETQIPNENDPDYDPQLGDASRMEKLGFRDSNTADPDAKDLIETSLERILDVLTVNAISKKHLEPLLGLHRAVQNTLAIAENEKLAKLTNIKKYLEVYGQMTLHAYKQRVLNAGVEAALNTMGGLTSTAATGWNVSSGIKNFVAGHFIQLGDFTAGFFAGKRDAGVMAKAYAETWRQMASIKPSDSNKMHSIMYGLRFADVDLENLKSSLNLKAGGNHFFSSRMAHMMNHAGDYFHRSHMAVTEMMRDGTYNAYEKVTINGEDGWAYNEDLDSRWQTPDGKKDIIRFKNVMKEQGMLDGKGRLLAPYSSEEIQRVKKLAHMSFESTQLSDNPTYKAYTIMRLLMGMQSWLAAKSERWWKKEGTYEALGKWNYEGEGDVPIWQGHYMEGMLQTWMHMGTSLHQYFTTEDGKNPVKIWQELSEYQKENIGRTVFDIGIAYMLLTAAKAMFGDDDEDYIRKTLLYKATVGSVEEIFMLEHLSAVGNLVYSPFPSVSIGLQLWEDMLSMDPERMAFGAARYGGPFKLYKQYVDFRGEINYWGK
jgi:hypothetical protein